MHARVIKDLGGAGHAQESRALLICLVTDLRYLFHVGALFKFAVFLTVFDDILCGGRVDARDMLEKGLGCGVEVNADGVYTVLNDTAQCLVKTGGLHIVLILTDTY